MLSIAHLPQPAPQLAAPPTTGALSIAYLPPQIPVRAMLVAHNADYNGSWPVWTKASTLGRQRRGTVRLLDSTCTAPYMPALADASRIAVHVQDSRVALTLTNHCHHVTPLHP